MKRPQTDDLGGMDGPGVALPKIKALDKLGSEFVDIRDQKAALATQLTDLTNRAVTLMQEHKVERYTFADQEIRIKTGKTKIVVKTIKGEDDE